MKHNDNNTNAFLIHISSFLGFLYPFGNIITPLIAWQTLKHRSPYLDRQGKEAINFNISYTLYLFVTTILTGSFFIGDLFKNFNNFGRHTHFNFDIDVGVIFGFLELGFIAGILYLIAIALIIIAAFKAKKGEEYKYPFTIKFIQ